MKRLAALGLLTVALVVPSAQARRAGSHTAPHVLTAFANLGTVYWRCARDGWSLGFGTYSNSADAYVRVGTSGAPRHVVPGRQTWFPAHAAKAQELTARRGIEPNTLTGHVTAHFHACLPYEPPTFDSTLRVELH